MTKPFRPKKIEWYWIEPKPEPPKTKRYLFSDPQFQFPIPTIRREA